MRPASSTSVSSEMVSSRSFLTVVSFARQRIVYPDYSGINKRSDRFFLSVEGVVTTDEGYIQRASRRGPLVRSQTRKLLLWGRLTLDADIAFLAVRRCTLGYSREFSNVALHISTRALSILRS